MSDRRVISLHHARQIIIASSARTQIECIPSKNALHSVLAEDIRASSDIPNQSEATRDGYAIIASDSFFATREYPVQLGIIKETVSAVNSPIISGTTVYVQSGDSIPLGANAVISKKSTYREPESPVVILLDAVEQGSGIHEAGVIAKKGDMQIPKGTPISAQHLGVLGLLGIDSVKVAVRPRIKILFSTASKNNSSIRSLEMWMRAKLDESNANLIDALPVKPGRLPVVEILSRDNPEVDLMMIILDNGQPSDPVINAMRYGSKMQFERIQMNPSGPVAFGINACLPILMCGLNNLDAVLEALLHPGLNEMTACRDTERRLLTAKSSVAIRNTPGSSSVLRATAEYIDSKIWVRPNNDCTPWTSTREPADGYILLHEESESIRRGDFVDFMQITH